MGPSQRIGGFAVKDKTEEEWGPITARGLGRQGRTPRRSGLLPRSEGQQETGRGKGRERGLTR